MGEGTMRSGLVRDSGEKLWRRHRREEREGRGWWNQEGVEVEGAKVGFRSSEMYRRNRDRRPSNFTQRKDPPVAEDLEKRDPKESEDGSPARRARKANRRRKTVPGIWKRSREKNKITD